jgi:hypothetical protein
MVLSIDDIEPPEFTARQGLLFLQTQSGSSYLIDLDAMRLVRTPMSTNKELAPAAGEPLSHRLRRDGQWLKIIHIGRVVVGERLELVLEPLGDPMTVAVTHRLTTEVVSISRWAQRSNEIEGRVGLD